MAGSEGVVGIGVDCVVDTFGVVEWDCFVIDVVLGSFVESCLLDVCRVRL